MVQSQGSYSEGLFTQDMFAMVQHEEGGVLVGGVHIGHIHNVHLTIVGQLLIAPPRPLNPCQYVSTHRNITATDDGNLENSIILQG